MESRSGQNDSVLSVVCVYLHVCIYACNEGGCVGGCVFRCFVPSVCAYISLALAGVTCPRVNAKTPSSDASPTEHSSELACAGQTSPEPFALQGKLFTELRVLHRELNVTVHAPAARGGVDGTLLGTIQHPKVTGRVCVCACVSLCFNRAVCLCVVHAIPLIGVDREISQWNWSRRGLPEWPTGHYRCYRGKTEPA